MVKKAKKSQAAYSRRLDIGLTVHVYQDQFPNKTKKPGRRYQYGNSATRLSLRDPMGFPSHPRRWFSIFVYQKF
jgi:hypothetical protein